MVLMLDILVLALTWLYDNLYNYFVFFSGIYVTIQAVDKAVEMTGDFSEDEEVFVECRKVKKELVPKAPLAEPEEFEFDDLGPATPSVKTVKQQKGTNGLDISDALSLQQVCTKDTGTSTTSLEKEGSDSYCPNGDYIIKSASKLTSCHKDNDYFLPTKQSQMQKASTITIQVSPSSESVFSTSTMNSITSSEVYRKLEHSPTMVCPKFKSNDDVQVKMKSDDSLPDEVIPVKRLDYVQKGKMAQPNNYDQIQNGNIGSPMFSAVVQNGEIGSFCDGEEQDFVETWELVQPVILEKVSTILQSEKEEVLGKFNTFSSSLVLACDTQFLVVIFYVRLSD